ncbi:MAG: ATP-binding protein, partial [Aquihabitans sp.]
MLVGRRDELELVRACVAEARPVVLVGDAGIGKSTLARAALAPDPFREGGALASLRWSPLLAFRRLLQDAPPELPVDVAGTVLSQGSSPVLLDDLQWADDATLEVVGLLVGSVPVVATVRTGEDGSDDAMTALELVGAERLDLHGLPDDAAAELALALHPELDPGEQDRLVAMAAGNPLLLSELPKGPDAAPSLVSTLLGRLHSLDRAGRTAMERLAVLGHPATVAVLGRGADALPALGLASAVDGRYEVRHSLLAEVIVDELGDRADAVRRDLAPLVDGPERAHLLAAVGDRDAARAVALEVAADEPDRRRR